MFNSGVPEKNIAENSGHKSTKPLCWYERTSNKQQKAVSKVIFEMCFSHQLQNALEVTNASKLVQSPVHLLENYFSH